MHWRHVVTCGLAAWIYSSGTPGQESSFSLVIQYSSDQILYNPSPLHNSKSLPVFHFFQSRFNFLPLVASLHSVYISLRSSCCYFIRLFLFSMSVFFSLLIKNYNTEAESFTFTQISQEGNDLMYDYTNNQKTYEKCGRNYSTFVIHMLYGFGSQLRRIPNKLFFIF